MRTVLRPRADLLLCLIYNHMNYNNVVPIVIFLLRPDDNVVLAFYVSEKNVFKANELAPLKYIDISVSIIP